MGTDPARKRGPRELVDIQGSLPPRSRPMHLDEQDLGTKVRRPTWMNKEILLLLKHS